MDVRVALARQETSLHHLLVLNAMAISGTDLLEVPTIYRAYVRAIGDIPQDMALYNTVPPF